MKHSCMVLASYLRTDCGQGAVRYKAARHIHRYLPGLHYLAFAGLREQIISCYIEIVAYDTLHLVYSQVALLLTDNLVRNLFCESH